MTERLLVVNADDFGLTKGVCHAILRAGRDGIVTSTSVLATGPALAGALPALRDSGLGIGAHLSAVGHHPPLLSSREIPSLVDRDGRLADSWRPFLIRLARGRIDLEDLEREFDAQLAALRGAGVEISHLDTHQNLHLWPPVARVLVELAGRWNVRALRVTRSNGRSPLAVAVRVFSRRLAHRAQRAGLTVPEASAGFDEAGRLDRDHLLRVIAQLASSRAATAELACHPSERDDADLASLHWGYRWSDELEALTAPDVRSAVHRAGFRLATFADLTERATSESVPRW
jgi:predicted glycoside hydrolase/deacetylase ChbG (UPF0249 family)